MKARDTNLLIRHLVEDDPEQLKVARRELELAARRGTPVWIADVTMMESFGVLWHGYGLGADAVCAILLALTEDARFGFQSGADVRLALPTTAPDPSFSFKRCTGRLQARHARPEGCKRPSCHPIHPRARLPVTPTEPPLPHTLCVASRSFSTLPATR